MSKPKPITVVHNFGGRRSTGVPVSVQEWGLWDCDPKKTGPPSRQHAYGKEFPWTFDKLEKAYILEGEATLTPDDAALHGEPVRIAPKDMVTFPRGWKGRWEVHSFLRKHYAFFDGKGLRIDEASDSEDEEEEAPKGSKGSGARAQDGKSKTTTPAKAKGKQKDGGAAAGGRKAPRAKAKKGAASSGNPPPAAKRRKAS